MTDCPHPDFAAEVDVNRLEDIGAFTADVRIRCIACGTRFQFIGPEVGLLGDRPMVSLDGCELHVPVRPEGEPRIGNTMVGFRVSSVTPRGDA